MFNYRYASIVPRGASRLFARQLIRRSHQLGFNLPRVREALHLASQTHAHQIRSVDGSPYLVHPLQVALLVLHWGGSEDDVIVALLHDCVEDAQIPAFAMLQLIAEAFGSTVSQCVATVSKDPAITDRAAREHEMHQRLLLALPLHGPGVAAVKLADRLHNSLTSLHLDDARLTRMQRDNRTHFVPLAQRLGATVLADILGAGPERWRQVAHAADTHSMWMLQSPWLCTAHSKSVTA